MVTFPPAWESLNVVLGHDWLTGLRGGERVLDLLGRAFPRAPLVTLLRAPGAMPPSLRDRPVTTSPLQKLPLVHRYYRRLLPLFPAAVAATRGPPCDLLLTTSHCAIKALRPPPGAAHLCYCFTPMRYVWTFPDEYFGRAGLRRAAVAPWLAALRRWDAATAGRVDRFVTLSCHVRERIWLHYERDADVVYPPVRLDLFTPPEAADVPPAEPFDLIVSALVPYKRVDLAVRLFSRLHRPLVVIGDGGEAARLRRMAGPSVRFLGRVPDAELVAWYRRCRCLVFPGEEDFGLVPLEAHACGRPVVAYGRGGAAESVVDGITGVLFAEQTEAALADALRRCDMTRWVSARIRAHAERFSEQAFIDGLAPLIDACLAMRRRRS